MGPLIKAALPPEGSLKALRAQLASSSLSVGGCASRPWSVVRVGIAAVDAELPDGGLALGRVHEWLGVQQKQTESVQRRREWLPAFTWVLPVMSGAMALAREGRARCVWVGPAVWAYPIAAAGLSGVPLNRWLCVRARSAGDRLWAADVALRCPSVAAVVVDGSGFGLAATRRLQLAAEAGSALGLVMRPPWEARELSAATTRWMVSAEPAPSIHQRWRLELRSCKGAGARMRGPREWIVERDHETRCLRVVSDICERSSETEAESAIHKPRRSA